ncbi:MAG: EVE domain-containing protein [Planctomycetota bacterium]|nr:MAG: EVE domain-containing protein [Planctomycetota bacterium]
MKYWLMKTEPNVYSIDDLKKDKREPWDGIRNYQARNFMRDDMEVDDMVLFYHSNAKPAGVAGIAKICSLPYPDPTAFDSTSKYFDPKSSEANPTWILVKVEFVNKFNDVVSLDDLRAAAGLSEMMVIKKGMRLSIQPVTKKEFNIVKKLGTKK